MSGQAVDSLGVVMFVMNDLLSDPRVQREARSAVRAGFRVKVVALQSERCRVPRELTDGYEVVRVQEPGLGIVSVVWRLLGLAFLVRLVLKEGVKLALGLPPGPDGPGQATGPVSRLRRIKWALMRGIGVLLLPLRIFRPFLGRLDRKPRAIVPSESPLNNLSAKARQYLNDVLFIRHLLRINFAMLRAVRSEQAAVFHGNDLPTLPLTTWAARRKGGKTVYDSHELWVGMSPDWSPFFNAVARWVEARYIRRMDAVITVNDLIADELRRLYQIPQPTVVMNCPERAAPAVLDLRYSIRAQLGLSPETPVILYQGRYQPGRGLEELIESGRYLTKGVIVLRGYGSNEPDLRRRVADLGGAGRVFMVEPVPMADLVDAAREADIGVVPYTACTPCNYYASPNKLFEYMLAGLAIAVSNLPIMEKLVRDHDLGVVFDPSDPRHIAEQFDALIGNPARLRACRDNARRAAHERYHWGYEGGKLVTLYSTLAGVATSQGGSPDQ